MTFEQARIRYEADARYAQMVNLLYHEIEEMSYTPGEVRDAAMLASLKFEVCRPFRDFFDPKVTIQDLFPSVPISDKEAG